MIEGYVVADDMSMERVVKTGKWKHDDMIMGGLERPAVKNFGGSSYSPCPPRRSATAINLFVRDMPRLPVDLDLVFSDHTLPRDEALARINEAVREAAARLGTRDFQTHAPVATAGETKLLVRRDAIQVKIEVNFVLRGTVQPVRRASFTPVARDVLMEDLEIPEVSLEDLYGGKLVS